MKALVISGGGVKGAFAVGVLKGLMDQYLAQNSSATANDFFKQYRIISGTSTGALITPLAAMGRMEDLIKLYTDGSKLESYYQWNSDGNFGNIFSWYKSVFNVDGLKQELRDRLAADYNILMEPDSPTIYFATVSMTTGERVYFSNKNNDFNNPDYRIQKVDSLGQMVDAIMASANQPVFAPLVSMKNDATGKNEEYADGGIREYIPIQAVLDQGATEIDVIVNSPLFFRREYPYPDLLKILNRTVELLTDEIGDSNVQYAKRLIDLKLENTPGITMQIFRPPLDGYGKNKDKEFPFKDSNLDFDAGKMMMLFDMGIEVSKKTIPDTYGVYPPK